MLSIGAIVWAGHSSHQSLSVSYLLLSAYRQTKKESLYVTRYQLMRFGIMNETPNLYFRNIKYRQLKLSAYTVAKQRTSQTHVTCLQFIPRLAPFARPVLPISFLCICHTDYIINFCFCAKNLLLFKIFLYTMLETTSPLHHQPDYVKMKKIWVLDT